MTLRIPGVLLIGTLIAVPQVRTVAIGLDLTNARSTLKNFDARNYPQLVEALRRRQLATPEFLPKTGCGSWMQRKCNEPLSGSLPGDYSPPF